MRATEGKAVQHAPLTTPVSVVPLIVQSRSAPNILVRLIWFVCIGLWLGAIVSVLAWALTVSLLGLPLWLWLLNRLPAVITLRPQEQSWHVVDGVLRQGQPQYGFLWRALYFLLVGWWFSGVWLVAAYLLVVGIVTLPLAFWMYGRVGAVTTLYRS